MSDSIPGNDQTYFIRNRGRVLGPFSIDKLKSLRARGQFSRVHEVSTDRANWSPASSLDGIFAAASAVGPTRGSVSPTADISAAQPNTELSGPPLLAGQNATGQIGTGQSGANAGVEQPIWYYRVNDQQYGPAMTAELRNLIASGRLGPLDYVWRDGLMEWSTVEDTAELGSRNLLPPGMPFAPGVDRRRRRTWVALILVLMLTAAAVASAYFGVWGKLAALIPAAAEGAAAGGGQNPLPAPAENEPGGDEDAGSAAL